MTVTHRTTSDPLATAAADLLRLIGDHADESIAELDHLERTYRQRLDTLPDAPELAGLQEDINLVRQVADDIGWIRTVAAQAVFELAVQREVLTDLQDRMSRLEQRPTTVLARGA
jgi:hypothetical protein